MGSWLDAILTSVAQVIAIQMVILFLSLLMLWMLRRRTGDSTGNSGYRRWSVADDSSSSVPSPESGGSEWASGWDYGTLSPWIDYYIKAAGIRLMSEKNQPQSAWQEAERRAAEFREKLQREQESAQPAEPSGQGTSATTADTVVVYDEVSEPTVEQLEYLLSRVGYIQISVREANELRFIMSKEFVTARAEAFHAMMKRIDRILTERGVEPIKTKFDLEKL